MKTKRDLFLATVILVASVFSTAQSLSTINNVTAEASPAFSFSVNQKVVMLDAGHGGWDPCC